MKQTITSGMFIVLFIQTVLAQDTTLYKQGFFIGNDFGTGDPAYTSQGMMGEIELIGSTYYLYFSIQDGTNAGNILYATSPDLQNWDIQDTIIFGVNNPTDRQFILGGPRVVKLTTGGYRMFYRTSQDYSQPNDPLYHLRSAFSSDGINFTPEGICIEINAYDPNSYFTHVGHSEIYYDAGGNMRALLTAEDTTMSAMNPDRIYFASSPDHGLTWTNFVPAYTGCHDPVVIIDSTGKYHAFFTYLDEGLKTMKSNNGALWPNTPDDLYLLDGTDTLTESSSPVKLADLGAAVDANGKIIVISNYASAPGPWTEIAYYTGDMVGMEEWTAKEIQVNVFPNPSNGKLTFEGIKEPFQLSVFDVAGKIVYHQTKQNPQVDVSFLTPGIYFYQLKDLNREILGEGKLMITK